MTHDVKLVSGVQIHFFTYISEHLLPDYSGPVFPGKFGSGG